MRPEVLWERRTRTHATLVIAAIVAFYLWLVIAMFMSVLMMTVSIGSFISGVLFLGAGWRALTIKVPATDPKRLVDLRVYPGLAEALEDAAQRVGAPLPDGVRITAAARIYAKEEGGILGGLFGSRRLLVVGAAALPYLTESEFRVLLARALAQWSDHETWYGVQARRMELAVSVIVEHLQRSWLRLFNPVYWQCYGYQHAFARLFARYLHERDLWADQAAALAYTAQDAESAIKKQALYDAFWLETLATEMTGGRTRTFQEVWTRVNQAATGYGQWEELWQRLLVTPRQPGDSEPALGERLDALAASESMIPAAVPARSPASAVLMR